MPEMIDRLEILPFGENDSYKKNFYIPQFHDSVQIADRCMTSNVKEYMLLRQMEPNWSEWIRKVRLGQFVYTNEIQKKILDDCSGATYPSNYPYSNGLYNNEIVKNLNI
jgi:hypothetical protein